MPIAELARRREIPVQFLEQLFATLRRAGILRSQRGVKGGYSFARPADEVTVLELVELLDGPLGRGGRPASSPTPPRPPRAVLAEATVAAVAEQEIRAAGRADVPHLTRNLCFAGSSCPRRRAQGPW